MTKRFLFAAVALAACSAPAGAAVTALGNSSARLCYEAAEALVAPGWDSLARCDFALTQEAITQNDRVATYVNRGILRARGGDIEGALADYDRAIAEDPALPEAYLNKGLALLRAGRDDDQAIALFGTALEKRTRRPAYAYFGRAVAYEMKGRAREAYLDYREANRLEPKWRDPKVELARFSVRDR